MSSAELDSWRRVLTRVVLGTVQLGMPYGLRAGAGMLPTEVSRRILNRAYSLGIRAFDTAEAYGSASMLLADWVKDSGNHNEIEIVTKVIPEPLATLSTRATFAASRFPECRRVSVFLHGVGTEAHWRALETSSATHLGLSVYETIQLELATSWQGVTRVQAPGNVLDHRMIEARGKVPIALDVRSIYLQGILLQPPEAAEHRLPGAGPIVSAIRKAANAAFADLDVLLVASVLAQVEPLDRVVLGIDDEKQLNVLVKLQAVSSDAVASFSAAVTPLRKRVNDRILDPRRWQVPQVL